MMATSVSGPKARARSTIAASPLGTNGNLAKELNVCR